MNGIFLRLVSDYILIDLMRIALVTIIEPRPDSGDGITEYTYRLLTELRKKKGNKVDVECALTGVRRSTEVGLFKAQFMQKAIAQKLAAKNYQIVHITHNEMGSVAKHLKGFSSNTTVVTTIHDVVGTMPIYKGSMKRKLYDQMVDRNIRDAIKYSDTIIFNSAQTKQETVSRYGSVKHGEVINNGIKDSILKTRPKPHKHKTDFVVGYLGSFATHKNVIAVLKTAEYLSAEQHIKFVVYGSGTEQNSVSAFKIAHNLTNVKLMGFAPENRVTKIFSSFDAFLFPSTHEGFGFPIIEAQALSLPVIIMSKSAISEEVSKYCIKALDEQHAAFQIKRLVSGAKLVDTRRAAAYARSFTWKKNAIRLQGIYKNLLTGKP